MGETKIVWTEYMMYRLNLRGYDLATVEHIFEILPRAIHRHGHGTRGRDWPT